MTHRGGNKTEKEEVGKFAIVQTVLFFLVSLVTDLWVSTAHDVIFVE